MFAAVVYATPCFITFVPIIPVQKDNIAIQIIYKGKIAIGFGPLIIFQLLALYKIYKSNICMQKSQHFTSTDHLLLFTSSAMFVYDVLRIIALIGSLAYRGNIDTFGTILQIIFWVFSIIHIWGQMKLLMTSQYIHRSMQSIPKFSRFTLIYVMSISVGQWFCDSIDHKWVENDHMGLVSELISMFGESQAKKTYCLFFFQSGISTLPLCPTT